MKILSYFILLISLSALGQDIESLSWDEAKINNRVTLTISKADFDKIYKKTDSIVAPEPGETCNTANEANVKMLHHKGVKYELDNGILNFRSIDFSKGRNTYITFKDDWFDGTTTLKNFTKTYPGASAFIEDFDSEEGDTYQMITLLPKDTTDNFDWRFFFLNGKLHAIECWFTCD